MWTLVPRMLYIQGRTRPALTWRLNSSSTLTIASIAGIVFRSASMMLSMLKLTYPQIKGNLPRQMPLTSNKRCKTARPVQQEARAKPVRGQCPKRRHQPLCRSFFASQLSESILRSYPRKQPGHVSPQCFHRFNGFSVLMNLARFPNRHRCSNMMNLARSFR